MSFIDKLNEPERSVAMIFLGNWPTEGKSDVQIAGYLANGALMWLIPYFTKGIPIHELRQPETLDRISGMDIDSKQMPDSMRRLKDALKIAGALQDWLHDGS